MLKILDRARWAPSGDNTQPWRFEIVSGSHIAIHGFDTREWCLYDFDGRPSLIAHGALLETLRIAATGFGLEARWSVRAGCPDIAPIYDVELSEVPGLVPDPLLAHIETRVVQRRPMRTKRLSAEQRDRLLAAPGPGFQVRLFESLAGRFAVAKLLWDSAHVRLTCPEAYAVHRQIIEWGARFSKDRIPEEAVGVDPMTARLMRWVMKDWARVEFFNRYLLGTVAPRVQLDFIPAFACAAHVLLRPERPPTTLGDHVRAGVAVQRLWLTIAALGLYLQPQMTPVIFRWYAQAGRQVSVKPGIDDAVRLLARRFDAITGFGAADSYAFFCRVGHSSQPASRSTRRDLDELMVGS
nr:molybdopterin biosynthesis protein MoeY [Aromatoleum petrolei]